MCTPLAMLLVVFAWLLLAGRAAGAQEKPGEQPLDLGRLEKPQEGLQQLVGEEAPVTVTGFAVPEYRADFHTGENSFRGSKLALSLFRPVGETLYFFGQLTTALEEDEAKGSGGIDTEANDLAGEMPGAGSPDEALEAGEASFETEIDNLIVSWTPVSLNQLNLSFGKFDAPVGFERDDEPLNLQPSNSFNFEFGRPVKVVGLVLRYTASPILDLTGYLVNGWDVGADDNKGKTVGGRIGVTPGERANVGLSAVYGPERPGQTEDQRFVADLDFTLQPSDEWIVGGEGDFGTEERGEEGEDLPAAEWYGGSITAFRLIGDHAGLALRYDYFRDRDGARTGVRQALQSFTIAPAYFLGTGREGIFSVIEHTSFHLPRFQLRGELRLNRSTAPFFAENGARSRFGAQGVVQGVFLF